jgi:hypothetical protein
MLIHVRKVVVVGPDELRVIAFSPSSGWTQEMGRMRTALGKRGTRYGKVALCDPAAIDRELMDRDDLFRCPACSDLRQCSVYENECDAIAESMSLLSICMRRDGQWAWVAPESVIDLSRVVEDAESASRMRRILGVQSVEDGGFAESLKDMLREEVHAAKGFANAVRSRLKRKVTATAGKAAGRAVDEGIDNVVDFGASTFKQRMRQAAGGYSYPSGEVRSERSRAAETLGVQEDASDEEIDKAWRSLAQAFHPDKHPDRQSWANTKMREINGARQTLKQR